MSNRKGRTGGKVVHLDPDTTERVEEYRAAFEAEHPGIKVTTGNALASLHSLFYAFGR